MFKNLLESWKLVLGFIVFIVVSTISVITWAEDTIEQEVTLMKAQAALVHNDYYQEGRIARKEDQIREHQRELENILEYIEEAEPTLRQSREIEYLDEEIARLRIDIENIRVTIASAHE